MAATADTNKCLRSFGWILATVVIFLVYAPYVIWGGIIIDDWAVVYHLADSPHPPSIWESYLSWFPLFSNRPLAPIALALTSHLFAGCPRGFILTNLCFWFGAILLLIAAVRPYHGPVFGYLLLLLAAFPAISSTVIFSPAMQMLGTISIFLWALSFWLLLREVACDRYSCVPYLLLLAALLTYEIILPLLSLTVLYPLALRPSNSTDRPSRRFSTCLAKYVLPVVLILLALLILQKWIMPRFMVVDSRLRLPRLGTGCFLCAAWFGSVLIFSAVAALECAVSSSGQLPSLLANDPHRHSSNQRLLCLATCEGLVFRLLLGSEVPTVRHNRPWFSVMSATLRLEQFSGLYRRV